MLLDTTFTRSRLRALACSAALATALTGALAGCGGSGQKPAVLGSTAPAATVDTPSDSPTSSAPSTPASASGGDWAAFPGFAAPADLKVVIDPTASTGNAAKDKVIADYAQVLRAMQVWSVTGDFNTPGVPTYLTAALKAEYQTQAAQYHASGKVPTGTLRYYDFKVPAIDARSARVIVCEDGRQGFDKDAKTGKVDPASADGIVAIVTTVVKDANGVWQAALMSKEKNSALCTAP
jgi:hypothetical protein